MKTSLFDFELPESLIADKPANPRDSSRMLIIPSPLMGEGQGGDDARNPPHPNLPPQGGKEHFVLGLTICYDLRFPQLYRALAKAGAQVIAVPSAFTQVTGEAHWHVLLRARAIENGGFVIAPAQTGTHPGNRKTYGHSLVVSPWGEVIADGGTDEGIVMADIDLEQVKKTRARIPSLEHDREFS